MERNISCGGISPNLQLDFRVEIKPTNIATALWRSFVISNTLDVSISSEFPYGYSLEYDRLKYYYSHYIFNHMYSLLGVDNVSFTYSTEKNEEDEFMIDVNCDSRFEKEKILSLILDVFDFDLESFREKIHGYNLIDDITHQDKIKPYLVQDLLEHVIII